MRQLNQLLLSDIPGGQPASPAAGDSLLYGRSTDRLYTATSTVSDLPLTPLYARLGTDLPSTSATVVTATGLSISVTPGTYIVRYIIGYKTTSTSTGITIALNGPTVSAVFTTVAIWTEASLPLRQVLTTHNTLTSVSGGSQGSTTVPLPLLITSRLTFTAAGTVVPRFSRLTTGTATLDATSVGYATWVPT